MSSMYLQVESYRQCLLVWVWEEKFDGITQSTTQLDWADEVNSASSGGLNVSGRSR